MPRTSLLLILIICAMQLVSAQGVTGRWEGTFTVTKPEICAGESGPWSAYLVDREGVLTGTYDSVVSGVVSGTSQGDNVRWTIGGSGGAAVSGAIIGNGFSGVFMNGEDCPGFGSTSGTVTGSKLPGEETPETTPKEPQVTVPPITTPTIETSEAAKQQILQAGTDLQEVYRLRRQMSAAIKASTMADNGVNRGAVLATLSNGGIEVKNYLNIGESETTLSTQEITYRIVQGTRSAETRANDLEQTVESGYVDLLKQDPTNFWANYDLATIKRGKGDNTAAYRYYLKASETISDEATARIFKEQAAIKTRQNLNLAELPAPGKSNFISQLGSDAGAWISKQGTSLFAKLITQDQAKFILSMTNSDPESSYLQSSARENAAAGWKG